MGFIRQYAFSAGELSPAMQGRHDLPGYAQGLRRLRNFLPRREGGLVTRPPTRYVATLGSEDGEARLLPFLAEGGASAYLVEIGAGYLRVRRDGALVATLAHGSGGQSVPWTGALHLLSFAQVGDELYLAHPAHPPHRLVRLSSSFRCEALDFTLPALKIGTGGGNLPYYEAREPEPLETAEDLAREWEWVVTFVLRRRDGSTYETARYRVTRRLTPSTGVTDLLPSPFEVVVSRRHPARIKYGAAGLVWDDAADTPIAARFYRGRGGVWGFVGEVVGSPRVPDEGTFLDEGAEPDTTRQPPRGTNPFEVRNGSGALLRVEHPATVAFYEGRLVFGGTSGRPGTVWFSRVNSFLDFDQPSPSPANLAVEVILASRRREEIRALVGLDRLLAFTSAGVWAISGAGGGNLSAADANPARLQAEEPCAHLPPLVAGGIPLFVHRDGRGVSELAFNADRGAFEPAELSLPASHLFRLPLVDWARAGDPWGAVLGVRRDGKLVSLTYSRESAGWAWHDGEGSFVALCTVPEAEGDALYAIVRHERPDGSHVRFLERFLSPEAASDPAEAPLLDCSLRQIVGGFGPTTNVGGLGHLEGREVTAVVNGNPAGRFTVSGGEIPLRLPAGIHTVVVGLPYLPELELLELAQGTGRAKIVKRALVEVESSRGFWVGEDFEHLTEWRQRRISHDFAPIPPETGTAEVRIAGTWGLHGGLALQQRDPLPLTILGISREVEGGG